MPHNDMPRDPNEGNIRKTRRYHKARMRRHAMNVYVGYRPTRRCRPEFRDEMRAAAAKLGDNITTRSDWIDRRDDTRQRILARLVDRETRREVRGAQTPGEVMEALRTAREARIDALIARMRVAFAPEVEAYYATHAEAL